MTRFLVASVLVFAVLRYATAATLDMSLHPKRGRQFNSAEGLRPRQNFGSSHQSDFGDGEFENQEPDDFYPDELPNSNAGFNHRENIKGSNNRGNGQVATVRPSQVNGGLNNRENSGFGSGQTQIFNNNFNTTTIRSPLNIVFNENTIVNNQIRDCIRNRCPTTNEYNPVCGDDNITYTNPSKLGCAQLCNSRVQMQYRGSCVTTRAPGT